MRLTLVISSLESGGAARVLSTLANSWVNRGWTVEILTTHDSGGAPHYPLDKRVLLQSVGGAAGRGRQFRILRDLRRRIKSQRPDCVISFLVFTNVMALLATGGLEIPVVVSERLDPRVKKIGALWHGLRRWTYRHATRLVAQTPTAAQLFQDWAPGAVRVIPNPVQSLADQPGFEEPVEFERPTILCLGRLMWQKGFDRALEAMALLPESCRDWQLVILGEGPLREALEEQRDELGLTERVLMPGRRPNPWPWLQAADVFLLSSRTEGFPNALCEAMAAGLPVVSTDCPSGPADILINGHDGLLVPVEDPKIMAAALTRLIESESERRALGRAAVQVMDRYSLPRVLELWDELLHEVVPEPPQQ